MLQAVMTKPGSIEIATVREPSIGDGQVAIGIRRIGVCGSDIHVYHGKHPYTRYPVVQGHEISGVVTAIGSGVRDLAPGDKVTIMPQLVCGRCSACAEGRYNICDELRVMGFQVTGAASQIFVTDASRIVKLPDSMSHDEGALVEPTAVAVHALGRTGTDLSGKRILVLGAGPIGNLIAQVAKAMGAAAVMITDLSEYRLSVAAECGIDHCVNASLDDLDRALVREFGAAKADIILECAGAQSTMNQAIANAKKGSDIVVVGVFADHISLDMGLVQDRELRLIGTLMYRADDYARAVALIAGGKIRLAPLISDRFDFVDYLKAYQYIDARKDKVMKVIIEVGEGGA